MQSYEVIVFIICLAAVFSYANHKFIGWTPTIGITALSIVASILLIAAAKLMPGQAAPLIHIITSIDFHSMLMNSMLSFLLFAGSMHMDAASLKKERLPILVLATVGILLSTFIVGTLFYYIFMLFQLNVGYLYCLLFAALISPTDPIAVLAILKKSGIRKSLELKIAGESLFNDGVAVVVFLTILEVAQTGVGNLSVVDVATLFLRDAGGGLLFGLLLGYLGFYAIRSVDQYEVEVLITLAVVMGGYLLADKLHVSGPLAMVVAGIVIGAKTKICGVSAMSKDYLAKFWELIDHVLNALLFMLIGFEMLVVKFDGLVLVIGAIGIAVVLLARWVSVALPVMLLRRQVKFEKHAIAILTWGGLRGGLSVALALSLPVTMYRDLFLSITYIVVVFSIIVQGLSIGTVYKRLTGK
jgi:CPA1 family monovalent cation:H+ antiporter